MLLFILAALLLLLLVMLLNYINLLLLVKHNYCKIVDKNNNFMNDNKVMFCTTVNSLLSLNGLSCSYKNKHTLYIYIRVYTKYAVNNISENQ